MVALKYGNSLFVANAGDSRSVLCRADGSAYALSEDHKPNDVSIPPISDTSILLCLSVSLLFCTVSMSVSFLFIFSCRVLLCYLMCAVVCMLVQKVELDRIHAAGGFVNGVGRINGNLNLSRYTQTEANEIHI